jgi:hypothetical protein
VASASIQEDLLPTLDILRNLFAAPTLDLKMTFALLRQDRYVLY